jgi:hypothetical protein
LVLLAFAVTLAASAETLVSVTFDQKGWDPGTWVIAKNPGVPHLGKWVQREKCIENETPTDPARKSALDATLTTMVYGKRFAGDCTAAATFEIGAGAAPGIVIAQDWAPDAEGQPQYGEFYEVVIYEKGVNLWHHFTKDGKPLYELTAYCNFSLKADTAYKLQVTRKAKTLEMSIAGQRMGVLVPALANELYFGVEGCEGVCRVYDFAVTR